MQIPGSVHFKILLTLVMLLFGMSALADAARIHKWVDEKGVTHYSDKIPAKDAGRDSLLLNNQGVVIRNNQASGKDQAEVDPEILEQQRRDRTLRASYTTADEIDLARDRSLQMDEAAMQALEQRQSNAENRLESIRKNIDRLQQRGTSLPEDLTEDLQKTESEISRIAQQRTRRKDNMEATRIRFERDKQRYLEITAPQSD